MTVTCRFCHEGELDRDGFCPWCGKSTSLPDIFSMRAELLAPILRLQAEREQAALDA